MNWRKKTQLKKKNRCGNPPVSFRCVWNIFGGFSIFFSSVEPSNFFIGPLGSVWFFVSIKSDWAPHLCVSSFVSSSISLSLSFCARTFSSDSLFSSVTVTAAAAAAVFFEGHTDNNRKSRTLSTSLLSFGDSFNLPPPPTANTTNTHPRNTRKETRREKPRAKRGNETSTLLGSRVQRSVRIPFRFRFLFCCCGCCFFILARPDGSDAHVCVGIARMRHDGNAAQPKAKNVVVAVVVFVFGLVAHFLAFLLCARCVSVARPTYKKATEKNRLVVHLAP